MKNRFKIFTTFLLLIFLFLFLTQISQASIFGGLEKTRKAAGFERETDITTTIGTIINIVLGFVGVIFLGLIIYGGFIWMLARGNEQEIEKAKKILEAAVIGIIIVFSAYTISYFIVSQFTAPTVTSPSVQKEKLTAQLSVNTQSLFALQGLKTVFVLLHKINLTNL